MYYLIEHCDDVGYILAQGSYKEMSARQTQESLSGTIIVNEEAFFQLYTLTDGHLEKNYDCDCGPAQTQFL